jgi:uncharacterized protein YciI
MPHFFCKLIAPRPTFPFDMNENEKVLMAQHAAYWAQICKDGAVLVYGPVMDPKGAYGMGVFQGADENEVRRKTDADPVIKTGIGFKVEIAPMQAMTRESCA